MRHPYILMSFRAGGRSEITIQTSSYPGSQHTATEAAKLCSFQIKARPSLETFSGDKLSDRLPWAIASFELATDQMFLGNAQQGAIPVNLLADANQFEAN